MVTVVCFVAVYCLAPEQQRLANGMPRGSYNVLQRFHIDHMAPWGGPTKAQLGPPTSKEEGMASVGMEKDARCGRTVFFSWAGRDSLRVCLCKLLVVVVVVVVVVFVAVAVLGTSWQVTSSTSSSSHFQGLLTGQ